MPSHKTALAKTVAPATIAAFTTFLEYTPPTRLSRNLRKMLMAWLITGHDSIPTYYEDLLHDLNNLFELLDEVTPNP